MSEHSLQLLCSTFKPNYIKTRLFECVELDVSDQCNDRQSYSNWAIKVLIAAYIVQDRVQSNELPLTQEFLSHMLGTRRSGVTETASNLSKAGIIYYSRGKIIINRKALESTSCECYQVIKKEFARFLENRQLA